MRRLLLLFGLLLLPALRAEAVPLYERIRADVQFELGSESTETDVAAFVAAYYANPWNTTIADVQAAVRGDEATVCGQAPTANRREWRCPRPYQGMRTLVEDETRIRLLGRRLAATAAGQELPVSDLPGRPAHFTLDLQGVLNMWGTGTGSVRASSSGVLVRTRPADPAAFNAAFASLNGALTAALTRERQTGIVWRYQYGHRLVAGARAPRFPAPFEFPGNGPGTEGQYLNKRWNTVENALAAIWTAMPQDPTAYDPPLRTNEVVYFLFPQSLTAQLPDNVIVWARMDGNPSENHPLGDVGLQWHMPLEPVLPSLLTEAGVAIRGGFYPPEPVVPSTNPPVPVDGRGLCSQPVARRGYLCRPMTQSEGESACPQVITDPNAIVITACSNIEKCRPDASGPFLFSGRMGNAWLAGSGRWTSATAFSITGRGGLDSGSNFTFTGNGTRFAGGATTWTGNGTTTNGNSPVTFTMTGLWTDNSVTAGGITVTINGAASSFAGGTVYIMPESCRESITGPDVCKDVRWRSEPFNTATNCKVQLSCAASCVPGVDASAVTYPKANDGTISICVNETPELPATYLLYHELAHAYQKCNLPVGHQLIDASLPVAERTEHCCRIEGEAYRAQYELMERDGVFRNADGTPIFVGSVPLNAETASEFMTNFACGEQLGLLGCPTSMNYPYAFQVQLYTTIQSNPRRVPATCSAAIASATIDARLASFKETIERRNDICAPGTFVQYKNKIGNTACYLGQCIEESLELHRITGGRVPATVGDPAFPWDSPITGTPLAQQLVAPAGTSPQLPVYRPGLLARQLDDELCQMQGLPPLAPSALCAIDAGRRLNLPIVLPMAATQAMVSQQTEREEPRRLLQRMGGALGARIGGEMYAQYLRSTTRSLAGIVDIAATLLRELSTTTFPNNMCSISPV